MAVMNRTILMTRRTLTLTCCLLVLAGTAMAQVQADARPQSASEEGPFKELKYRSIGPAAGGRVCRVAGVSGNPLIYLAATASGGVWRSTDGGLSWKCVTEKLPT